jgi:4-amino-4-deoxy-L-arabinose transferase-like glycosyltransferase
MFGRRRFHSGVGRLAAPRGIVRLIPLGLFVAALLPRLVALNRYVTPDETVWAYRSLQFREALLAGRWADTLVAGHPGVTTTWLGAAGMTVQRWLSGDARAAYDWLAKMAYLTPDNVEAFRRLALFLTSGRITVALVNCLGIVAIYFLARRLWGGTAALVAGLLLAFDPFLAGLSGLLHVDGLSATFVSLSLLSLALGLSPRKGGGPSWGWVAVAGAMAGLAALSKTPTLVLLPVTALGALWTVSRGGRPWRDWIVSLARVAVMWGAAFLLTVVLLYPALWVAPGAVVATVGGSANRHLDEALRETFFFGRVAFDHGPLFYPVVLLWRLSPVVWLALIPAVGGFIRHRRKGDGHVGGAVPILLLAAWAVVFLLAITPAAKKFDRYILPVVPALLVLAGLAWAWWGRDRARGWLAAMVLLQGVYWLAFAAYPLTAYNPLVGGPFTAARVLPIGWGEGIGAAGRELTRTQPNAAGERAMAGVASSLAPFFAGHTLVEGWDDPATADYVIVTRGGRQLDPAGVAAQTAGLPLVLTERFGGLEQAWVYRQTPESPTAPPSLPEPITFGDRIALVAIDQMAGDERLELKARWRRLAPLSDERFTVRIAIRDTDGNIWGAQETDLLNEVYFFPADWEADETGVIRYPFELPPGMPPGRYQVALSLIDNGTAGQLPVRVGGESFKGVVYEVGEVVVPVPAEIVTATRMQIAAPSGRMWLDGRLQLLGAGHTTGEALAGSQLAVELFWHAPQGPLPPGIELVWTLRDAAGAGRVIHTAPLSRYDTGQWRAGESIHEMVRPPLPPDLPPGDYTLEIAPAAPGAPPEAPYTLGNLRINNIDRLYEVPMDVARPLLDDCFGETLCLRGALLPALTTAPGQTVELILYWQALKEPPDVYTVFLHVLNEAGDIVLTADHWPSGLPSDILDVGQVVEDRVPLAFPAGLPPGPYRIRLGLYMAETGQRLPVAAGGPDAGAPDHILLPMTLRVVAP